jgi:regulatory protein
MFVDEAYIKEHFCTQMLLDKNEGNRTQKSAQEQKESTKAFNKIALLIKYRDRSVYEIRKRLGEAQFSETAIEDAIERACRCGYLDDQRFAESFTRSRIRAGKGLHGIIKDLNKHEIDPFTLEGFPYSCLPKDYDAIKSALALLKRKPPRAKNQKQAAYAKLIREGYTSTQAVEAVNLWVSATLSK